MDSQNEATPDTGKPNARAGRRDVVKGLKNEEEGTVMRNWKYDGWTEQDWERLTEESATLNALAQDFDNAIGGGGGGFTPAELQEFQRLLEVMAGRIKQIWNNYY
jgi:hypothetical protein